jgi:hypothetical protein
VLAGCVVADWQAFAPSQAVCERTSRSGRGRLCDGGSVDPRYDTVNRSLSKARNESILLNILRAAHEWPLSFTTVPHSQSRHDQRDHGRAAELSPRPSYRAPQVAGVAASGYSLPSSSPMRDVNFRQQHALQSDPKSPRASASLRIETGTFYNGLLSPVSLHDLNYFIRQATRASCCSGCLPDTVEVFFGNQVIGFQYNPPDDYGCPVHEPKRRCFREFVEIATITGLSVEAKTMRPGSGGGGSAKGGGGGDSSAADGVVTEGASNPKAVAAVVAVASQRRAAGAWQRAQD